MKAALAEHALPNVAWASARVCQNVIVAPVQYQSCTQTRAEAHATVALQQQLGRYPRQIDDAAAAI